MIRRFRLWFETNLMTAAFMAFWVIAMLVLGAVIQAGR